MKNYRYVASSGWFAVLVLLVGLPARADRRVVSLNGTWHVAEGSMDALPDEFPHRTVPVPGLVDMADPPFADVGTEAGQSHRQAFWYYRTFKLQGELPAVVQLKIHKACFGTRVYLNGALVGDHLPSFTPALFDSKQHVLGQGQENELIVRVGSHRTSLPPGIPDGWDFEKVRYLPGIYDSVELILCGSPQVVRVQAVPDPEHSRVRVVATIRADEPITVAGISCRVREVAGGRVAGESLSGPVPLQAGEETDVELTVPIDGARLWSPEDPFLYELETSTGADTLVVRFGMRSFHFCPQTRQPMLNGRPYPLRGTNVTVYRFFEDPERGDRPWRAEWVRRLHRTFKAMNWNTARYCIGFPPKQWYDIADEEGLLIQDEFPIWYLDQWPAELTSEQLIQEYTQWMQERWNHPSVVIWDAQNETHTRETGKAIAAVRGLDLSDRPWNNGWGRPDRPTDVYESHPYAFLSLDDVPSTFRLPHFAALPREPGVPGGLQGNLLPNTGRNPVIINEYGWLWLNRDGSPTTLSKANYQALLGPDSTADQRRELYAKYLAAITEFWRGSRQVAGILHFCGLGYSRPGGQTSDHFVDLETLALDPYFRRYVGEAFAPVGVVLDYWGQDLPLGASHAFPIELVNDLHESWEGMLTLRLARASEPAVEPTGAVLAEQSRTVRIEPSGRELVELQLPVPAEPGEYVLTAEISDRDGRLARSVRDVTLLTETQRELRDGIAVGKPVRASSVVTFSGTRFPAEHAVDGTSGTRWSSEFADPQWIAIDLGRPERISRVVLLWQGAYAKSFSIQVSLDGDHWTDVFTTNQGQGGREVIPFPPTEARWVRMHGTQRGTPFGYSLWQFQVFRPENNPLDPPEISPAPEPMENPDAASASFRADPRPTRTAHPAGRYVANR